MRTARRRFLYLRRNWLMLAVVGFLAADVLKGPAYRLVGLSLDGVAMREYERRIGELHDAVVRLQEQQTQLDVAIMRQLVMLDRRVEAMGSR